MTGAGSADALFAHESSFKGSPVDSDSDSEPEYYGFGREPTINELNLNRQLERLREPLSPEAAESIAGYLEGAVEIEAVVSADTYPEVEQFVFNDGGGGFTTGRPNSTRVYTDVDFLDGTVARELVGVIPLEYSLDYEGGGMVTYTLSMGYATENTDTSINVSPSDITRPANGSSAPFHAFDLSIAGTSVSKLQSASLGISGISRFIRGAESEPVDAVIGNIETTLDATAVISGRDKYELALGAADATTVQDTMASKSATITLTVGGSTLSTYSLPQVKPDSYSWESIIAADEDAAESYTMHVNGGISIT